MKETPVWLAPRDFQRSLELYGSNADFRHWLSVVDRFSQQRVQEIAALSPRSMTELPPKALRNRVDFFIRCDEVQWWQLHRQWMRRRGALAGIPLDHRKAAFFELWDGWRSSGSLPWELDAGKPTYEPFEVRGMLKTDGQRWRTYCNFGIARRTRQAIVQIALSAAGRATYRTQFMYVEGGRKAALAEIVAAIDDDGQLDHWAKLDLANCFDNINLARAHEVLPVKRKVVQHTIGIDRRVAKDRRSKEQMRSDVSHESTSQMAPFMCNDELGEKTGCFASRYPLQLPQGAACSPFVAYWLIEEGLGPVNAARAFMYGDDLLILGRTETEVHAEAYRFVNSFAKHAAGPLQVGSLEFGTLEDGVDFLGLNVMVNSRRNRGALSGCAGTVGLSSDALERCLVRLGEKVEAGSMMGDPALSEANCYIERLLNVSPQEAHGRIVFEAVAIAERISADSDAILEWWGRQR